ncbi:hypothetical protein FE257_000141 [Aspergillus nanangensis]|uniref:Zn(2)-C6 fungal-type domain-containing protein n=1 Tax=Aspergillus nanangensis TaxID=2582783 RepID=A0AAD4CYY4_ASPNN|nr:hypothetical protein FE257_000141 [Aspergillus nanangensis]
MRGCLTCRQRHLKCDKTGTECLRCQRSGRQCIPAPVRQEEVTFRHGQNPSLRPRGPPRYGESDLSFPDDQVWVDMPPEVAFEDETDRTAADYNVVPVGPTPLYVREASDSQSSSSIAAFPPPPISGPPETGSNAQSQRYTGARANLLPPDPLGDNQKLSSFNEAFLLRRFRNTLGAWLDVCDHERHFSTDVVESAPGCPLLLYACLATAARYLSSSVPPRTADEYHERCIAILLPGLEHRDFQINIEILLAATVILRFFEQISSHNPSSDQQRHLLAGSVYIGAHVECATSGGLAEASFWVYVMQDIQFALVYRNPLRLTIGSFQEQLRQKWEQIEFQTDRDWTRRAIWLLAETINYCYGANGPMTVNLNYDDTLKRKICAWDAESPDRFRPLHYSPANQAAGRPFPVILFTSPSHAIAIQHICMAKALILESELKSVDASNARIKKDHLMENLSILFGIALSTDDEPALRFMACHALCACGTWIHDPLSQNCLLDLLRRTEAENGWPWAYAIFGSVDTATLQLLSTTVIILGISIDGYLTIPNVCDGFHGNLDLNAAKGYFEICVKDGDLRMKVDFSVGECKVQQEVNLVTLGF